MKYLVAFILFLPLGALAANRCVGPSASGSGTGSDWTNQMAWSATPARGDTWYIRAGTYGSKTLSTAIDGGGTVITIKKATSGDHVTDNGWQTWMGSTNALILDVGNPANPTQVCCGTVDITTSGWTIDGVTGGGVMNGWSNNFGIKIQSDNAVLVLMAKHASGTMSNITVKHIEMQGRGSVDYNDAFAMSAESVQLNHVILSYNWLHGIGRSPFLMDNYVSDWLIEHTWVQSYNGLGPNDIHTDMISSGGSINANGGGTFRYNLVTDYQGSGAAGLMWNNASTPTTKCYIYGNVWWPSSALAGHALTTLAWNGMIGTWSGGSGEAAYNCYIFNNTFINVPPAFGILMTQGGTWAGNLFANNLIYNCNPPSWAFVDAHYYDHFISSGSTSGDANASTGSGDPFSNLNAITFTLAANTPSGTNLSAMISTTDMYGNTRSTWTRGAVEFSSGTTNAPTITNPTGVTNWSGADVSLSVTASGGGTLTYAWQMNSNNIPGATSATYTTSSVPASVSGWYRCLVTNEAGFTNSANAYVQITNAAPLIGTQPTVQTNFTGETMTFAVSASGSQPLAYQWSHNGSPVSNATNATYAIANAQVSDSGNYLVTVTNSYGSLDSVTVYGSVTAASRPGVFAVYTNAISSAASSLTINSVTVDGARRALQVWVNEYNGAGGSVSGVVWNGLPLTFLYRTNYYTANGVVELWGLTGPPQATANLTITTSVAVGELRATAIAWTNADQSSPFDAPVSVEYDSTHSSPGTVNVAAGTGSNPNESCSDFIVTAGTDWTKDSSQTLWCYLNDSNGGTRIAASVKAATSASTTMQWTGPGDSLTLAAVGVKGYVSGTTGGGSTGVVQSKYVGRAKHH